MINRRSFLSAGASAAVGSFFSGCLAERAETTRCPRWRPGEMEIHFIHTGAGEQTFFVFPDGTTMLLDCGDVARTRKPAYAESIPLRPSGERAPGEWVRRYLERLTDRRTVDYLMVTHWHNDHVLGIPDVARSFRFGTFLCHQRSGERFRYRYGVDPASEAFATEWLPKACAEGLSDCPFEVGALNQIALRHDAAHRYDGLFEIRNIAANGVVWDGASAMRDCAAEHVRATGKNQISENTLSAAIRIRYGRFSCFFGGDIGCDLTAADGKRYSYEGLVGSVVGPVDVCKANHHGYWDSMKEPFVRAVRPRVYLSSSWSPNQINDRNLPIMASRELYPGDRTFFVGFLPDEKRRDYAGRPFMKDMAPFQGHQVVKVSPGGETYEVFVLDAADESGRVLYRKELVSGERGVS